MAEIGLEADVQETKDGEDFVDHSVADGRIDVGGDEEVLYSLEEFHGEEEKDTRGECSVVSS